MSKIDELDDLRAENARLRQQVAVAREALTQYARFDFYLFLTSYEGMQANPTKKAEDALSALDETKGAE